MLGWKDTIVTILIIVLVYLFVLFINEVLYYNVSYYSIIVISIPILAIVLRADAHFLLFRGINRLKNKKYDSALEDFDASIKIRQNFGYAYMMRAVTYANKGLFGDAIADCTRIINHHSEFVKWAYEFRAACYWAKGDFKSALNDYECLKKYNTMNYEFYSTMGWLYFLNGDLDKAIQDCSKSIEMNQNKAAPYGTRGSARFSKGETEVALSDFKKAIQLWGPNTAGSYYNLGFLSYNEKNFEQAVANWEKAVEMIPHWKNPLEQWIHKAKQNIRKASE